MALSWNFPGCRSSADEVRNKECDDEFASRPVAIYDAVARTGAETDRRVPVFVNDGLDAARELGLPFCP